MSARLSARDEAVANVGRPRRRGKPRRFDCEVRLMLDADLDLRVRSFAEVEQISNSEAWRLLVTIALNSLERKP